MANRIPTNLITGFLGVGKTTAVIDMLRRKNPAERWAVLVNEYGEVGIDGAMIEGAGAGPGEAGFTVQEVAGGCVCCTTAPFFPVALYMLLQEGRPDRLLVETTGLGHPARLLETLRGPDYADRLDVRAALGIVAPADFNCPGMFENPVFMDQVHLADVLVLNKRDQIDDNVVSSFQQWANRLFPPKLLVAATTRGTIDLDWLDLTSAHERVPLFPEAHEHSHTVARHPEDQPLLQLPTKGKPVRYASPDRSRPACGWIFNSADIFDEGRLLALANRPEFTRFKGVFHLEDEWISINKSGTDVTVKHSAYRRDSRVELFADQHEVNWIDVEKDLLQCLSIATDEQNPSTSITSSQGTSLPNPR
ncbi:MAG: GTP-binding protein [Gemmataceae bacterium]